MIRRLAGQLGQVLISHQFSSVSGAGWGFDHRGEFMPSYRDDFVWAGMKLTQTWC